MIVVGLDVPWPLTHAPLKVWTYNSWHCAIAMGYTSINGYVRVPASSPLRRYVGTSEIELDDLEINIHGGLTYGPVLIEAFKIPETDRELPRLEKTWADTQGWVGFDTGHYCDVWDLNELVFDSPEQMRAAECMAEIGSLNRDGFAVHWTTQKVIEETELLCSQLQAAEHIISEREQNASSSGR